MSLVDGHRSWLRCEAPVCRCEFDCRLWGRSNKSGEFLARRHPNISNFLADPRLFLIVIAASVTHSGAAYIPLACGRVSGSACIMRLEQARAAAGALIKE